MSLANLERSGTLSGAYPTKKTLGSLFTTLFNTLSTPFDGMIKLDLPDFSKEIIVLFLPTISIDRSKVHNFNRVLVLLNNEADKNRLVTNFFLIHTGNISGQS